MAARFCLSDTHYLFPRNTSHLSKVPRSCLSAKQWTTGAEKQRVVSVVSVEDRVATNGGFFILPRARIRGTGVGGAFPPHVQEVHVREWLLPIVPNILFCIVRDERVSGVKNISRSVSLLLSRSRRASVPLSRSTFPGRVRSLSWRFHRVGRFARSCPIRLGPISRFNLNFIHRCLTLTPALFVCLPCFVIEATVSAPLANSPFIANSIWLQAHVVAIFVRCSQRTKKSAVPRNFIRRLFRSVFVCQLYWLVEGWWNLVRI